MRRILLSLLLIASFASSAKAEAPDLAPVKRWIARQSDFHSVSADFTQTRALKALRSPLASEGHLWFKAPDSFRWELGRPAKTVVLRKGDVVYLIQPGKKRIERSAIGAAGKGSAAQVLGMMSFPFARDFADFQKQFETLSVRADDGRCHLEVLPRDLRAQKMLSALKLDFDTSSGHLLSFEMDTRDGSSLRNEFSNVQVNARIDRAVFDYDFTGYEVVDAK